MHQRLNFETPCGPGDTCREKATAHWILKYVALFRKRKKSPSPNHIHRSSIVEESLTCFAKHKLYVIKTFLQNSLDSILLAKPVSMRFKTGLYCQTLHENFLFCVLKVFSYNKYIGPYAAEHMAEKMKFWNQDNETCKFQYDGYGELSCRYVSSTNFTLSPIFMKKINW